MLSKVDKVKENVELFQIHSKSIINHNPKLVIKIMMCIAPVVAEFGKKLRECSFLTIAAVTLMAVSLVSAQPAASRPIWFGTTLNADTVVSRAQKLAKSLANLSSATWQVKGDQKRTYRFPDANADEPYRLCVPTSWDGSSKLALVMFLHGAGNTESSYLEQNNKQMINLAAQHKVLLVSPMGDKGAYGNFLRLTAPFGDSVSAANLMAQVTTASERTNELSEQDVINVLELILSEYPIDRNAMFLTGHSMGSGGTWIIGGKYSRYWRAIAPMSGPFVQKSTYPWDKVCLMPVFITEGTQAPSLSASRLLRDWMIAQNMIVKYKEVNADHPGMVPLVLPDVFNFFDSCRTVTVNINNTPNFQKVSGITRIKACFQSPQTFRLSLPEQYQARNAKVSIYDLTGNVVAEKQLMVEKSQTEIHNMKLSSETYTISINSAIRNERVLFSVVK
jgi:poly(3-hydroxybutyrate) depolymerase